MPHDGAKAEGNEAVRKLIEKDKMSLEKMPTLELEVAKTAAKAQIVHSSFTDPGDDWNRWDFFDIEGKRIASFTEKGF